MLGPRRVGKTTCLYQAVRHLLRAGVDPKRIWWLRLDHPLLMPAGLEGVDAIRADAKPNQPAFVFLDELTYANDWDLWLKTFYEHWPIRLAGSSSSTAVRQRFLLTGGFPELLLSEGHDVPQDEASLLLRSQRRLGDDAVERAIYKDIPQAFSIDSLMMLERPLYVLAAQVTGLLSPQTVCKALGGLSQNLVAPNVPAIRTRGQPGQIGLLPLYLLLLAISRQADAVL